MDLLYPRLFLRVKKNRALAGPKGVLVLITRQESNRYYIFKIL